MNKFSRRRKFNPNRFLENYKKLFLMTDWDLIEKSFVLYFCLTVVSNHNSIASKQSCFIKCVHVKI